MLSHGPGFPGILGIKCHSNIVYSIELGLCLLDLFLKRLPLFCNLFVGKMYSVFQCCEQLALNQIKLEQRNAKNSSHLSIDAGLVNFIQTLKCEPKCNHNNSKLKNREQLQIGLGFKSFMNI